MTPSHILSTLAARQPLFSSIPKPARKQIIGVEVELGVERDMDLPPLGDETFSRWFSNGGRTYLDQGLLELNTPETSNPLSAVLYTQAMFRVARTIEGFTALFANNTDWNEEPISFGSHENYFSRLRNVRHYELIPYLVARTLLCGSGHLTIRGAYLMSQRAQFIRDWANSDTTRVRGIVGSRHDSQDTDMTNYTRVHLILGDTNMSEVAMFLKVGMAALAVRLMEAESLPPLFFEESMIVSDLHRLSWQTADWLTTSSFGKISNWVMESLIPRRSVLEVLWLFVDKAKEVFGTSDVITQAFLAIMEDTLVKLEKDPWSLVGRLDWVTKLWLLREFVTLDGRPEENTENNFLHLKDVGYHNLNPDYGDYFMLHREGIMERLFTDGLIRRAQELAPTDTRAYFRGRIVQLMNKSGTYSCTGTNWGKVVLKHNWTGEEESVPSIPNPFLSYRTQFLQVRSSFKHRL